MYESESEMEKYLKFIFPEKFQLNGNKRALFLNFSLLCAQMVMEIIRTFIALRFMSNSLCMIFRMISMLQYMKSKLPISVHSDRPVKVKILILINLMTMMIMYSHLEVS